MTNSKIPNEALLDDTRYSVLGAPISVTTLKAACQTIGTWAKDDIGRFVCVRDVASLLAITEDQEIRELHNHASMIVPDGMPLVWIGRALRLPVKRVCGPDLFEEMMRTSGKSNLKHYFFGGRDGVAAKLAQVMQQRFPDVQIVGWESPPFGEISVDEYNRTIQRLKESGADVIWVGISSPKQDVWMWKSYVHLSQTLIGVGAAFDFHSNKVKRAPKWLQKTGLEWAYRVAQEPKRLGLRYAYAVPAFAIKIALGAFDAGSFEITRRPGR